ncbi:spermidine synthase [Fictibacillus iocasae]|uniref:Polyamine aminopropyltransferase n=1 Tax=Fictibacillus iocasae TaxID=2715437 RepID=A0ABW2NTK1_9BACL
MSKLNNLNAKPWYNSALIGNQLDKQKPTLPAPRKNSNGDVWDKVGIQELLNGSHKKLYTGKSEFQDIFVVEATDIRMYLNEQLQFSSLDERIYHQALVHPAFHLSPSKKSVLILGGGDGLALREVFHYDEVEKVVLVDIDPKVIQTSKTVPAIVELNEGSLLDKRVTVTVQDAWEFVFSGTSTFDIIIVDFPDPAEEILARLYAVEMFRKLYSRLSDNGVIVCQSNSPSDAPSVYWSIGRTMKHAGFHTLGYHTIVPSFGDWGFHIGRKSVIKAEDDFQTPFNRSVPSFQKMCEFPKSILSLSKNAELNSVKNLVLHELYADEMEF